MPKKRKKQEGERTSRKIKHHSQVELQQTSQAKEKLLTVKTTEQLTGPVSRTREITSKANEIILSDSESNFCTKWISKWREKIENKNDHRKSER